MNKKQQDKLIRLVDAAALGSVEAAEPLGIGYYDGSLTGVKDLRKAVKWCHYAARKGSVKAEEILSKIENLQ